MDEKNLIDNELDILIENMIELRKETDKEIAQYEANQILIDLAKLYGKSFGFDDKTKKLIRAYWNIEE